MTLRSILIWVRGSLQLAAVCCALFLVPAAHANLLIDGSFENTFDGIPEDRFFLGGYMDGHWWVNGSIISLVGGGWQASDGGVSVELAGLGDGGAVFQSFATTPGQGYLVTFDLSGNPDNSHGDPTLKQLNAQALEGTDNEYVYGNTLALQAFVFDTAAKHNSTTDMKWERKSFMFIADTDKSVVFFYPKTSDGVIWSAPAIDNVSVVAIPEPGTSIMILCGLAALTLVTGLRIRP